jgi:hypothetical protein
MKYDIQSVYPTMSMVVKFLKPAEAEGEPESLSLVVSVDYAQGRVFFQGDPVPGIDYAVLEQDILKHIQPPEVVPPDLPPDLVNRVNKVREGNYQYGADIEGFQEFTK